MLFPLALCFTDGKLRLRELSLGWSPAGPFTRAFLNPGNLVTGGSATGPFLLSLMEKETEVQETKELSKATQHAGRDRTQVWFPTSWMARSLRKEIPAPTWAASPSFSPATPSPPPIPLLYDLFYEPGLAASTLPWEPALCRLLAALSEIGNFKSGANRGVGVEGASEDWGYGTPGMHGACLPLCSAPAPMCQGAQGLHSWETMEPLEPWRGLELAGK